MITRDALAELIGNYFGLADKDGTYWHILTRCKSSREVGTMSIDDFEEVDFNSVDELADLIFTELTKGPG